MSNPEKTKMDTEEEINENSDDTDYTWSDEEGEVREIVCALPALRVSESPDLEEALRQKAVVAAELVMAAAEEAAVSQGKMDQTVGAIGEDIKNKKLGRRARTDVKSDDAVSAAGASGSKAIESAGEEEPAKKPKKKGSSLLRDPPQGPPKCNVCGRDFASWKAVFGHLRAHKDRGYLGFLPPPTFNPAVEGFGGAVAASSGGGGIGLGSGGLGIDLNADPVEKEEEGRSGSIPNFDLNRSPPQDEEEEKEDKAE